MNQPYTVDYLLHVEQVLVWINTVRGVQLMGHATVESDGDCFTLKTHIYCSATASEVLITAIESGVILYAWEVAPIHMVYGDTFNLTVHIWSGSWFFSTRRPLGYVDPQ